MLFVIHVMSSAGTLFFFAELVNSVKTTAVSYICIIVFYSYSDIDTTLLL